MEAGQDGGGRLRAWGCAGVGVWCGGEWGGRVVVRVRWIQRVRVWGNNGRRLRRHRRVGGADGVKGVSRSGRGGRGLG
jgi:hypothetical protein